MQDTQQNEPPKLLDQERGKIRLKHYSIRSDQAYADWIKRFIFYFDKRHPRTHVARGGQSVRCVKIAASLHGNDLINAIII